MATMHLGKGAGKQGWAEWEDDEWAEEWGEEEYAGGAAAAGYYGQSWDDEGAGWDIFEIDLYSMVLTLDETLAPQDLYAGFEFNDKNFLMVLGAEDIEEHSPAAWKARPLKIHPEPAPRTEKKAETTPRTAFGTVIDADASGANTPTQGSGPPTAVASPQVANNSQAALASQNASEIVAAAPNLPRLPDIGTPQRPNGNDVGDDLRASPDGSPKTPAQPGPTAVQSPKIFLSDNQLETLKQKMQALKQKRSVTPMSLPPAHDEDGPATIEASPRDRASDNGTPTAAQPIVHSNCPQKHGLKLFKTPDPGWWCSVCEREHGKGAPFYGCRKCDYDECEACALKSRTAPTSSKPSPRGSPRASPRVSPARAASRGASPAGSKSASSSPPIRRQVSSAKKEKLSSRRESKAAAVAAAAASDDSDADDGEDDARPKGKQSRRKRSDKIRTRRAAAAPDHWEPKEKTRSPPTSAPLRRRRESGTAKEDRKDTTAKKRAALERRTSPQSSPKERSSSEEPPPKKRAAKAARPSSSESEEPPARGKASWNARHKAAASPEVPSRAKRKAAVNSSPEPEAAPARKLGAAAQRPQRGITGPGGANDFLRKVLQAGQGEGPAARLGRGRPEPAPRKEPPAPEPKEPVRPAPVKSPPIREPRSAQGQRAPRTALGIISSQIQQNSRRV